MDDVVAVYQRLPELDSDVEDKVEVGLQTDSDVEDKVEVGLRTRKSQRYSISMFQSVTMENGGDEEPSQKNAYLDKNGGAAANLDIHKVPSVVLIGTVATGRERIIGRSESIDEEITEEEVVELEFEKVKPKLHTHTMHCPNCKSEITKVVLRRRVITLKPHFAQVPRQSHEPHEPQELLGCLACLSVFTNLGKGIFKSVTIFPKRSSSNADSLHDETKGKAVYREDAWPHVTGVITFKPEDGLPPSSHNQSQLDVGQQEDVSIDMPSSAGRQDSFEILKSIVYGGLMEVIASLSVVSSAAASDATTLSIVALALANLIGGIFVVGHKIWDLKDDCYKFCNQQPNNADHRTKYSELLGSVKHFPMHMFVAILSFLVFGIIPPLAYGYAIQVTNDKDFTMILVAAASFVCVGLLAIFKAYNDRCDGSLGYVKVITYYLTAAVTASGVSYAAGTLVTRLIKELGWFDTSSGLSMSLFHEVGSTSAHLA